jgi:hypothetical protein
MEDDVKKVQKQYCSRAMFYAISAALILIIIGEKAIAKGLVLGTLFSVINFVIMGFLIPRQVAGSQKRVRAGSLAFFSIFLRFSILAIPLIISQKVEAVNFFGTAVGIFMIQFTILFNNLIVKRFLNIRKA